MRWKKFNLVNRGTSDGWSVGLRCIGFSLMCSDMSKRRGVGLVGKWISLLVFRGMDDGCSVGLGAKGLVWCVYIE